MDIKAKRCKKKFETKYGCSIVLLEYDKIWGWYRKKYLSIRITRWNSLGQLVYDDFFYVLLCLAVFHYV
jgi:hypothetical protein